VALLDLETTMVVALLALETLVVLLDLEPLAVLVNTFALFGNNGNMEGIFVGFGVPAVSAVPSAGSSEGGINTASMT